VVVRVLRRPRVRFPRRDADTCGERGMSGGTKFQESLLDPGTSRAGRYRDLVVGVEAGWGGLVRFEIVTALAGNLPGALGLALRGSLYRGLFRALGRGAAL